MFVGPRADDIVGVEQRRHATKLARNGERLGDECARLIDRRRNELMVGHEARNERAQVGAVVPVVGKVVQLDAWLAANHVATPRHPVSCVRVSFVSS